MSLPPTLQEQLTTILGPIDHVQPTFGGDINQAARLVCGDTSFFVKWNANAPEDMFSREAHGLQLLAAADAVRIPEVIACDFPTEACSGFLLLEWIETRGRGVRSDATMERFGQNLAVLHRQTHRSHGLDRDNYIGRLPQPNPYTSSWTDFYREHRLRYQMELARERGRLPARRERLLTKLMDRLDDLLDDDAISPSLLHGDLWGGNYLIDDQGEAVLIDPAVYYGHREMDLAMSQLFGGFSGRFYAAYRDAYPLDGYEERRALYQLYYILVHLNLFGESYGGRVDSLAAHYVGRG